MRCLTLAKALRAKGAICQFISRQHEGNMLELIRAEGFQSSVLPKHVEVGKENQELTIGHSTWLGASWQEDAQQTLEALSDTKPDWLVIDHYALDERWEKRLSHHVGRIMVIDDLADREHFCDLLLDQNFTLNANFRYENLTPSQCSCLIGPKYALLQSEYSQLHPRTPPRNGEIKRILIFFGGVDFHNLTELSLSAFLALKRYDIIVDIVVNPEGNNAASIREMAAGHTNVNVHGLLPSLAPLMLQADFAIGAGGATSWERCCLGLPSLVVTLAENQKHIAKTLDEHNLARWIGHYDEVSERSITEHLRLALAEPDLEKWSSSCLELVDAQGVERVTSMMLLHNNTPIKARLAYLNDEAFALHCFSSHIARKNAYPDTKIKFRDFLRSPDSKKIYILETQNDVRLGVVIFSRAGSEWEIIQITTPEARYLDLQDKFIEIAILKFRHEISENLTFYISGPTSSKLPTTLLEQYSDTNARPSQLSVSICSDRMSWINESVPKPILQWLKAGHKCSWSHKAEHLPGGDLCFYLSYGRIVGKEIRSKYKNNLVVHASDLPKGRGWSPTSWIILEGGRNIPVTLLEAIDAVDAGVIYDQRWFELCVTDLIDDWRRKLADTTVELILDFTKNYPSSLDLKREQSGDSTFYPKRSASDSRLDKDKTIAQQFNILRIVDNEHYPAFFEIDGCEFVVNISKRKCEKH